MVGLRAQAESQYFGDFLRESLPDLAALYRATVNRRVVGSSPSSGAISFNDLLDKIERVKSLILGWWLF